MLKVLGKLLCSLGMHNRGSTHRQMVFETEMVYEKNTRRCKRCGVKEVQIC
jgi:hypothetical protein